MRFLDECTACFTSGTIFKTVWRHQVFKIMYVHFNLKMDPPGIFHHGPNIRNDEE